MDTLTQSRRQIATKKSDQFDLIIIGGGPAGLASAIKAKQLNLDVLVIEKALFGGNLLNIAMINDYLGFPDQISGKELSVKIIEQFKSEKIDFKYEEVMQLNKDKSFEVITDKASYHSKAVIIASGTQNRKLSAVGEEKYYGRGVSYCAPCDAVFFKDKHVIVAGNNERAIKSAILLTNYCQKVSLFTVKTYLNISEDLKSDLKANKKIEIFLNHRIEEILGNESVEKFIIKNLENNKLFYYQAEAIFIYVGVLPENFFVPKGLSTSEKGYLDCDKEMQTAIPGLFVAGDIRNSFIKKVSTAIADGIIAASSAYHYLSLH